MARAPRTVVTLGSLPGRVEQIVPVVRALLDQGPDRVYVWIPELFRRGGVAGAIPSTLAELESRSEGRLHVELVPDRGPITKLLPVLDRETDPETRIVVTDDDSLVVHPRWLEDLLRFLGPETAVGYSGFRIVKTLSHWPCTVVCDHLAAVDVLEGFCGYALRRGWLGRELVDLVERLTADWDRHQGLICSDDLIVSRYLQRVGVETRLIGSHEIHRYNVIQKTSYESRHALHLMYGTQDSNLRNYRAGDDLLGRLLEAIVPPPTARAGP
jgi:hypothetical protein